MEALFSLPYGMRMMITQSRCCLFKTYWKSSTFEKCPNTSKKSHAHLQCVHINRARFEECQPKGVGGVD
jgi:hypothetical protein